MKIQPSLANYSHSSPMLHWIPPEETIRGPDNTGIGIFTTSHLEVTLSNTRVSVRLEDSNSVTCLKQQRNQ